MQQPNNSNEVYQIQHNQIFRTITHDYREDTRNKKNVCSVVDSDTSSRNFKPSCQEGDVLGFETWSGVNFLNI